MPVPKKKRKKTLPDAALFCLLIAPAGLFAQTQNPVWNASFLKKNEVVFKTNKTFYTYLFYNIKKESSPPPVSALLPAWSEECLPFFCKLEHRAARSNRLPVKFRLGSVPYVDKLEGKPGYTLPE